MHLPLTIVGFCLHLAIGAGFGAIFLSAAYARSYHARSVWNFWRIAVHYGAILVAVLVLVPVMVFVRNYPPQSWANVLALVSSTLVTALFGWRLLFASRTIDAKPHD
jgi:protein-S-isoprenylcysteine O-methyltransferase Ste14